MEMTVAAYFEMIRWNRWVDVRCSHHHLVHLVLYFFLLFLHGALRERPRRAVWLPRWGVARYVMLIFRLASVANHHGHASLRLWRSAGEYPFSFFSTSSAQHLLFPCNSSLRPQISWPEALGVLVRAFPSAVAAARPLSLSDLRPTAVY